MDQRGKITSIVQDHVQGLSAGERREGLVDAPQVLLFGLTLPREDGNASGSNAFFSSSQFSYRFGRTIYPRSCGMVLSGENVLRSIGLIEREMEVNVAGHTQDDHVTSAPRAVKVSMRTAVWMVLKS